MAGGFHTYGQNQMWRMEPGWDQTFDTPGADQVAKMKAIVTSLPWWDMVPGPGPVRDRHRQRAHTERGAAVARWAARARLPLEPDDSAAAPRQDRGEERAGHVDQPGDRREAGRRDVSATGNLNGKTFPESKTQMFTVPGHWEDAVLLLEAAP